MPASARDTRSTRGWHHAYLLVGGKEACKKLFEEKLSQLEFNPQGNPDFYSLNLDTLGIDEARLISERASLKPFGEKKVFYISADTYTLEAQNALLKTLEDPTSNTHFFIQVGARGELIPTLLSRVEVLQARYGKKDTEEAEKFLKLAPAKRIAFAKKFADDEADLGEFLESLLVLEKERGNSKVLNGIYNFRRYAGDRSAQSRLVLEHLALVL